MKKDRDTRLAPNERIFQGFQNGLKFLLVFFNFQWRNQPFKSASFFKIRIVNWERKRKRKRWKRLENRPLPHPYWAGAVRAKNKNHKKSKV